MKWLIALIVLSSLVSCVHKPPPDVPMFMELTDSRAIYNYTVSERGGIVDDNNLFFDARFMSEPQNWTQLKKFSVVMPNFSYSELNKYISKKEIKK